MESVNSKELNDFKIEVLTQLAVINSKLDTYNKTQEIATQADNRSKQNENEIQEIKDNNKWAFRISIGAIITSGIGILVAIFKRGIGM